MTLDAIVKEVETTSAKELQQLQAKVEAEVKAIEAQARAEAAKIREDATRKTKLESERERARLLASAKLQAKKQVFEAREKRTEAALEMVRQRLAAYTKAPEYAALLERMVAVGTATLGSDVRLYARSEDASLLPASASRLVVKDKPLKALGGIIVEKADRTRRLNLTFDEILRTREDRVREVLAR